MIDLSAVPEDEDAEEDADEDNNIDSNLLEPESFQEPGNANLDLSPGGASAMSATTGKTTFSQEEIADLDPDVMLDSLKKLDGASNDLLNALMPSVPVDVDGLFITCDEIATSGTRASKIYQKRLTAFMLYKSDFTTAQAAEFIRPHNVSRALFDVTSIEGIPDGARRPDSIMYKANLASMLHMILVSIRNAEVDSLPQILESVDQAFPTVVAGSEYNPLAVALSIGLTTQLAVNKIQGSAKDASFDPHRIATETFFTEDGYRHYDALHLGNVPQHQEDAALDRINNIVSGIKETFDDRGGMDPILAIEKLRDTYSWGNFLGSDLVPYMMERKRTLDHEVHMAGGIDSLDLDIKRSVQNKDSFKEMAAARAMLEQNRQHPGPSKGNPTSAAQYLRSLSQPAAPSQQGVAPTAQMTAPALNNGGQQAGTYPQFDHVGGSAQDPAISDSNLHELSAFQDMDKAHTASAAKGVGKQRRSTSARLARSASSGTNPRLSQVWCPTFRRRRITTACSANAPAMVKKSTGIPPRMVARKKTRTMPSRPIASTTLQPTHAASKPRTLCKVLALPLASRFAPSMISSNPPRNAGTRDPASPRLRNTQAPSTSPRPSGLTPTRTLLPPARPLLKSTSKQPGLPASTAF
jgi:hypothetical protein